MRPCQLASIFLPSACPSVKCDYRHTHSKYAHYIGKMFQCVHKLMSQSHYSHFNISDIWIGQGINAHM